MSSEHPGQRWVLKPVYHKLTGNDNEVMYPPPLPLQQNTALPLIRNV